MFDNFWDTEETIAEGLGFKLFSLPHLADLAFCLAAIVIISAIYRKADEKKRNRMKKIIVLLMFADEAFKHIGLIANGNWMMKYLPLHLCSINIFNCAIHAFSKRKSNLLANFLYCICVPGALVAELTPAWQMLPTCNFMHLHSVSVHMLLIVYPVMLFVAREAKRSYRYIPKMMMILIGMAIPIYFFNVRFDTNFMFLITPLAGTPLVLFDKWFGNHLIGYALFVPLIMLLMYIPYKNQTVEN